MLSEQQLSSIEYHLVIADFFLSIYKQDLRISGILCYQLGTVKCAFMWPTQHVDLVCIERLYIHSSACELRYHKSNIHPLYGVLRCGYTISEDHTSNRKDHKEGVQIKMCHQQNTLLIRFEHNSITVRTTMSPYFYSNIIYQFA